MKIEQLVEKFKNDSEEFSKSGKTGFSMPEALHTICEEIICLKGSPKTYTKKSSTPFIKDPELFKAVNFADAMVKKGTAHGLAVQKASDYYHVSVHDVASELAKRG